MAGEQSDREAFFWGLTLECGITMHRSHLEWVESVIRRVKKKQHPAAQAVLGRMLIQLAVRSVLTNQVLQH